VVLLADGLSMGLLAARAIECTELSASPPSQESLSLRRLPCEVYFYLCPCQCAPVLCAANVGIFSPPATRLHSCDVAGGHDYVYENISSPARCEFGAPVAPFPIA